MTIKVLIRNKNELKFRITGESHAELQMFRKRLNEMTNVVYANYFPGHPELDDPEFYIRTKGKANPEKLLQDLCKNLISEFENSRI